MTGKTIGWSAISQPIKKEEKMPIQVIIKRKLIIDKPEEVFPLFTALHSQAMQQPGYIDSKTLKNIDKPQEYMVISTWETADDWRTWFQSKERRDIQGRVDSLIGERTHYSVYEDVRH
jgi:heme-degrading monooxygenase HmoA